MRLTKAHIIALIMGMFLVVLASSKAFVQVQGTGGGVGGNPTTPAPPASISLDPECAMVIVHWGSSAGAANYKVLRGTSANGPFDTIVSNLASDVREYSDVSPDYQATYYYRVEGTNSAGDGSPVQANTTTLAALFSLSASVVGTEISLTWPTYTGEAKVMRGTVAGGPYNVVADLGLNAPYTSNAYPDSPGYGATFYYRLFSPTQGWISSEASGSPNLMSVPIQIVPNPTGGYLPDPMILPAWMEHTMATDESDAPGGGPASAFSTDMAHGVVTVAPCVDLVASNPTGPDASFERSYRTAMAAGNLSSPGLPPGWTHNWDFRLVPTATGWGTLQFVYPSGASETLTPILNGGTPTGAFTAPQGAPYIVTGIPGAKAGIWTSITFQYNGLAKDIYAIPANDSVYRLTTQIGANGQPINLTYSSGKLDQIDNANGGAPTMEISLTYSNGLLQTVTDDATGNFRKFGYQNGELQTVYQINSTSAADWSFAYQTLNNQPYLNAVTTKDPQGTSQTAHMDYDASTGCASTFTDAKSNIRTYSHSPTGGGGTIVNDGSSNVEQYATTCDALGRVTLLTTDAGDSTTYAYSSSDPAVVADVIRPLGGPMHTEVDTHGSPTQITYPYGNYTVIQWAYPTEAPLGRIISVQDHGRDGWAKAATTFDYYTAEDGGSSPIGFLKAVHYPEGDLVTYTYTALGNVLGVVGSHTSATYDYSVLDPQGDTGLERLGLPYSVTDGMGKKTWFQYDAAGRLTSTMDPLGHVTNASYNEYDQNTSVTVGVGTNLQKSLSLAYGVNGKDPLRAILSVPNQQDQTLSQASYDGEGGVSGTSDGNNNADALSLDSLFGLHQMTNGNNKPMHTFTPHLATRSEDVAIGSGSRGVSYTLKSDANGNPHERTGWHAIKYAGDSADPSYIVGTTDALGNLHTYYMRDSFGRLIQTWAHTDGYGDWPDHTYTYDDEDRILSDQFVVNDLSSNYAMIKYTYNTDGTRQSMWFRFHQVVQGVGIFRGVLYQYTYDNDDRMTGVVVKRTDGDGNIDSPLTLAYANYHYDSGGRIYQVETPYNQAAYTYNNLDQLVELDNSAGSTFSNLGYDSHGNLIGMDATVPGPSGLVTGNVTYAYDPGDRLTGESWSGGLGAPVSYTYAYDNADNLTTIRSQAQSVEQTADQLTATFRYGSVTYNASGEMTHWGGSANWNEQTSTFGYDNFYDGVQVYVLQGIVGDTEAFHVHRAQSYFQYDNLGHRIATAGDFEDLDGIHVDGGWVRNSYDGDELLSRHVNPPAVGDIGAFPIASDLSAAPDMFYLWGPTGVAVEFDVDGDGSSTSKSFIFDPEGNCVGTTNGGGYVATLFDAYGKPLWAPSSDPTGLIKAFYQPFQYKGQYGYHTDALTGLCYCLNRYYDPGSGRWISRDPIGLEGGVNTYAYCGGNPVMSADPSGLQEFPFGVNTNTQNGYNAALGSLVGINTQADCNHFWGQLAKHTADEGPGIWGILGGIAYYGAYKHDWTAADNCVGRGLLDIGLLCLGGEGEALEGAEVGLEEGRILRGGLSPVLKGQEGENAVRELFDIGPKRRVLVNGRVTEADGLNDSTWAEIKNVKRQGLTVQIKRGQQGALDRALRYILYINDDAKLSKPLMRAHAEGRVNIIGYHIK